MTDQLSSHFSLPEFCSSQVAARMGLAIVPDNEQRANLERLCLTLLEPIRVALDKPMVISSGLRPQWLNEIIGGAANSAHMYGLAADVKVVGMSAQQFAAWVRAQGFPALDQCIEEFGQWVHLAIADGTKPRNQYLVASHIAGETHYQAMA